ncbi:MULTISPECIES: GGDEF domain-containing protein [Paenibacillus]|uniref:GGDEF domain-containing protein n=1 Tax=Paenibacillus TaxID=44249 RepID=UPI0022B883BA|nr:GGDEF domain-containing protein [Paenibacillus caseinilyticus]MCZ8517993.1 GGDEF domain-containing protein [Paenibacillus caseinilyticus]
MNPNPMSLRDMLYGPAGSVYLYSLLIVIILMTMMVSFRLLLSRRKIGYLSMIIALGLLVIQHIQMIVLAYSGELSPGEEYTSLLLKVLAFVTVNAGIYQLYNATKQRDFILYGCTAAVTVLVSLTYWSAHRWLAGSPQLQPLMRPLGMELFLFVLIFLCFMLVHPRIGQNGKYQTMLTVYFASHAIHMANVYLFGGKQGELRLLELAVPFFFYIVLFLFIVERVIEILQAIYTSSITDGLTKLYNRKYFETRVSQHIKSGAPVSLIFSDIDNFKQLNDTKGHHMGDKVLKQVARILAEETEEIGICSRYGGEELVILVNDLDTDALELAERIRMRVEKETAVTLSIGCKRWRKRMTAGTLIKGADKAMYEAKTTGKNKVVQG